MDKPISLSIKEWIIRNMSTKMMISERTIETVINDQFTSASVAMDNCNSVEFSGFGKFYFNEKRAITKLNKFNTQKDGFEKILNNEGSSDEKKRIAELKLNTVLKNINLLTPKIHESASTI